LPATGREIFEIADDEMEIGMGLHGEPGVERTKLLSADETVARMIPQIIADLSAMFGSAVTAVQARGKAGEGDKTMVDALAPAARALQAAAADRVGPREALRMAAKAAAEGAEGTRTMLARAGRARYQGEKSVGHIDAGAASIALIFRVLAEVAAGAESGAQP
jgi:dihydroxyacetone kinase